MLCGWRYVCIALSLVVVLVVLIYYDQLRSEQHKPRTMKGFLRLRFPDQSLSTLIRDTPLIVGRGNPPCLADPACSRKQFIISRIHDAPCTLSLQVMRHVHASLPWC